MDFFQNGCSDRKQKEQSNSQEAGECKTDCLHEIREKGCLYDKSFRNSKEENNNSEIFIGRRDCILDARRRCIP